MESNLDTQKIGKFPRKNKVKHTYMEAFPVAELVKARFKKYDLAEVGSLARKSPEVGDLDFVTNNKQFVRDHGKYHKDSIQHEGKIYKFDIWYYENKLFGKFLRSYPSHVIIAIRKGLKDKGYRLSNESVTNLETKEKVPNIAIKKIFELADVKYKPLSSYF